MLIVFSISIFLLTSGAIISYLSSYLCIIETYFPFLYFILPSNSKMICNSSFGRGAFIIVSFHGMTLYLGAFLFWFWELFPFCELFSKKLLHIPNRMTRGVHMIDAIRMPTMMHELFVIGGTAFDTAIHAKGLRPCLILLIELFDHIRSQSKRRVSFVVMR